MGRDTFHQIRLLKAPSNLALNTAREGVFTVSLGNVFEGLTALTAKNFFLIPNVNLPSFSLKPSSLSTVGLLGCKHTLLRHAELLINTNSSSKVSQKQ